MQITALVLLVLCGVINYLDRSALAVANVLIRQELGLNATSMGVLLSAFLLAYALSQIPVGFLIDRLGPRTLLGCAITLWSIAQAACGFIGSFTQFYFARIGLGIGEFAQFPTGIRVVNNWFHVSKRGLPTGIFNSASFLGTALAPPLLTVIMLAYGWRMMFIIMGVLGFVAAFIWVLFYRDPTDGLHAGRNCVYTLRRHRAYEFAGQSQAVGAPVPVPHHVGRDPGHAGRPIPDLDVLHVAAGVPGNPAAHDHFPHRDLCRHSTDRWHGWFGCRRLLNGLAVALGFLAADLPQDPAGVRPYRHGDPGDCHRVRQ